MVVMNGRPRADLRVAGRMAAARARGRPWILSHLLTDRCNAVCRTCLWRRWPASDEADGAAFGDGRLSPSELSTDEVSWLYRQAGALGVAQLVVWGGEPLLRPDLPELLLAARRAGLSAAVITNGWLLPERWPALRGRVDTLIVSLDDIGSAHDRLRALPGLYRRIDAFVRTLRSDPLRPRLLVNTVLSRLNRGALRRVAPVAREWGAGLYFCPMETGEMTSAGLVESKAGLALPPDELREAAGLALQLQGAGYPLLATKAYLRMLAEKPSLSDYRCRAPHATLTVQAGGAIRDCLRRETPLDSLHRLRERGARLADVVASPRYQAMLASANRCTVCNNPDVLETTWAWQLRPFMLRRALRLARA